MAGAELAKLAMAVDRLAKVGYFGKSRSAILMHCAYGPEVAHVVAVLRGRLACRPQQAL